MSIIYGLIDYENQFDGQQVLSQMHDACTEFEYDNRKEVFHNKAAFGNLLRHTTSESIEEDLPYEYNDFIITSYSRLDNRDFLIK